MPLPTTRHRPAAQPRRNPIAQRAGPVLACLLLVAGCASPLPPVLWLRLPAQVPGVTDKQVDAKAATVTVTFDPERTSIPVVARAITDAGFPAKARANGG